MDLFARGRKFQGGELFRERVRFAKAVVLQWEQFPPGDRVAPAGS